MSISDTIQPAPRAGAWSSLRRVLWIPLVVWLASVPVAECAYRIAGVRIPGSIGGIYEQFGAKGYRLRANAAVFQNWQSGTFWVYTDAHGCRVGASNRDATTRQPDVLVLGDSQAFGQGVDFEPSLVGQFCSAASQAGIAVTNAAVGGHSLLDQIDLASRLVCEEGLRPRAVLLCLTPRSIAYPDSRANALVVDGVLWDIEPSIAALSRKWLSSNSAFYVTVRNALKKGIQARPAADIFTLYDAGPKQDERLPSLVAAVRALQAAFEPGRVRLVLAYLPLAVEHKIEAMAKATGADASPAATIRTAQRLAEAVAMDFVDCSQALAAVRDRGLQVQLNGDEHYGAAASREVAELIWRSVDWLAKVGNNQGNPQKQ